MFEHLLVPLDGSRLAEDVLPVVESFAARLGARVTLLHVLERDAPQSVHGDPHVTGAAEGAQYLGRVADRLQTAGVDVDVHVHARSVDDVVAAIDAHAHEFGVDLIAMCKHGRSGLRQRLMGGIAQQLLRGGGTPILLRSPRERPSTATFDVGNILVPLESRHDAESALAAAARLASAYGAAVQLVTLVPSLADARSTNPLARLLPGATSETLRMEGEDVGSSLRSYAAKLEADGIRVDTAVRSDDPATGILGEADRIDADVVVLSTHARASFEAWYTGSTGNRVITESQRTLLLLREL